MGKSQWESHSGCKDARILYTQESQWVSRCEIPPFSRFRRSSPHTRVEICCMRQGRDTYQIRAPSSFIRGEDCRHATLCPRYQDPKSSASPLNIEREIEGATIASYRIHHFPRSPWPSRKGVPFGGHLRAIFALKIVGKLHCILGIKGPNLPPRQRT